MVSGLKPLITAKEKIALLKFSMPPVAKNNDEIVKQISPLLTNMPPCAGPLSVKIKVFWAHPLLSLSAAQGLSFGKTISEEELQITWKSYLSQSYHQSLNWRESVICKLLHSCHTELREFIPHISQHRRWCTFFKPVYFLALANLNYFVANLSTFYVLFTSAVVYQNW